MTAGGAAAYLVDLVGGKYDPDSSHYGGANIGAGYLAALGIFIFFICVIGYDSAKRLEREEKARRAADATRDATT